MRLAALAMFCAAAASAQTATVGLEGSPTGFSAQGAVDVAFARDFASTLALATRLVTAVSVTSTGALAPQDLGSAVSLRFRRADWDAEAVLVELFPIDGQRVRATFDPANLWGAPVRNDGFAPALRARLVLPAMELWAGGQAYPLQARTFGQSQIGWAALFGGGFAVAPEVKAELILALADRGGLPLGGSPGRLFSTGATARLAWNANGGVGPAYDPASLANDPDRFERLFARDASDAANAATVSLEGGVATQELINLLQVFERTRVLTGFADLQARARFGALRLFAGFRFRGMDFVPFDGPGVPPFFALPRSGSTKQDEYTWLAGADRRFAGTWLTPGLTVQVQRPASFGSPGAVVDGIILGAQQVVVRAKNAIAVLPTGGRPRPRVDAIATLKLDRFAFLHALLVVHYTFDPNRTWVPSGNTGPVETSYLPPHDIRVQLLLQSSF